MDFKVGDVVYLNSNPDIPMTVSLVFTTDDVCRYGDKYFNQHIKCLGFSDGDNVIQCSWFNVYDKKMVEFEIDFFKPIMLKLKSRFTRCQAFKTGDRVYLRSNPYFPLTVSMVLKTEDIYRLDRKSIKKLIQDLGSFDDGDVQCKWLDKLENEVVKRFFKAAILTKNH